MLIAASAAGVTHAEGRNPLKIADAQYEPVLFNDMVTSSLSMTSLIYG